MCIKNNKLIPGFPRNYWLTFTIIDVNFYFEIFLIIIMYLIVDLFVNYLNNSRNGEFN